MTALRHCRLETDAEGIAWLTLDKADASANSLGSEMMREADEVLRQLEASPPRGVVIRSGKRSGFVAGADINEFTTLQDVAQAERLVKAGQSVIDRFEALPCPTVAAIEGFALGGGLELALACTYRVAVGNDRHTLGFPEVLLGIHPGFGGTVRSVRLIGASAALDLMLTGRNVRGAKALTVRPQAHARFNAQLQQDLAGTAWAGSCSSWYKTDSGKITNNWSGDTATYVKLMKQQALEDYEVA
jgi:3-hydroxyacyl-CoA dehydrogenase/enoyl-CoA hydratase/3-hydroxybutyryl-CoA epimerase